MLNYAGLGKSSDSFGGGIGEEQYASFLRDAQAKEMVKQGGIGLAEMIFESLKESANER
jgi:flagellar protein FlgJ